MIFHRKTVVVTLVILCLLGSIGSIAEIGVSSNVFTPFQNDEKKHEEALKYLPIKALKGYTELNHGIDGIAIAPNGNIAIKTGPCTDDKYDCLIYILDSNGQFLSGYEVGGSLGKLGDIVFYTDDNLLCYSAMGFPDEGDLGCTQRVYVFEEKGNGIIASYTMTATDLIAKYYNVPSYFTEVAINICEGAGVILESYSEAVLVISDNEGHQKEVFNQKKEYEKYKNKFKREKVIMGGIFFFAALCGIFLIIYSKKKE